MGMRLTNASDYAIRAMVHLACFPDGGMALRSEIAEAQGIPLSFMAKILRRLVQAQLLHSSRGVRGGFGLARSADEITLLDIVEAIEGPLAVCDCASEADACVWADRCPASVVWPIVQQSLEDSLRSFTLEDLVSVRLRNGKVVRAPKPEDVPPHQLAVAVAH